MIQGGDNTSQITYLRSYESTQCQTYRRYQEYNIIYRPDKKKKKAREKKKKQEMRKGQDEKKKLPI